MSTSRFVQLEMLESLGSPSRRFMDLEQDKLRGGYYTSTEVAAWLCSWAIRHPEEAVLEPSCGDGAFLDAAISRYQELGATASQIGARLRGIEIVPAEADRAAKHIRRTLGSAAERVVRNSDFFLWWQGTSQPAFDVIVGNPPFIRYQSFPEPHRSRAMEIMSAQGLTPNKLTNIWVPFVVAASASLKPGGRLALVLPAEIFQVTYAAQLRSFLTDRFERIDIVSCNELIFERAEQEVVLLLADGALTLASKENTCHVTLTEAATVAEITQCSPAVLLRHAEPKTIRHDSEKWLKYFLNNRQIAFMRELREATITTSLVTHASIDVGVVTGKNEFFVLSEEQVEVLGLQEHTIPLVSRSMQLKGALIDRMDWESLAASGSRVHLLHIQPDITRSLDIRLRHYIEEGERRMYHTGYKCSIRDPWYSVPSVWVPDGFLFRQIYDFPRMVLNKSGATSTDTIHRMTSKSAEPERVIANTYTWLTAASAEIEGRSYGGGVLELEPTEAERLLMPVHLNGAMPLHEADQLTRAGRLDDVLEANARIVLHEHMGLSTADCILLRDIWVRMRNRRQTRRRNGKKTATAGQLV